MPIKEALRQALRDAFISKEVGDYDRSNVARRFIRKYYPRRHENLTIRKSHA